MKRYQKVLIWVGLLAFLIVAGVHIYITFYLEDQIQDTVIEKVNTAADDRYVFDIADLSLNIFGRRLQLEGVTLNSTENSPRQIEVTVGAIAFSGISVSSLLNGRELVVSRLDIASPAISITEAVDDNSSQESGLKDLTPKATQQILSVLNRLSISEIVLNSIEFDLKRNGDEVPYFSFSETDLIFYNTELDSSTTTTEKILPVEEMEGTLRNAEFRTKNGLYVIKSEKFEFSSVTGAASAESIRLDPALTEQDFFDKVGHRTDRVEATVSEADLDGIQFDQLLHMERLDLEEIALNEVDIRVFRNKHYPEKENKSEKPLPQQMLHNLDFPVIVNSLSLTESYIRYTELEEHTDERGYLDFTNLNATISNITNIPERIDENGDLVLEAETDVMDKSRLNAQFVLPLRGLSQTITGTLEPMDATELNRILKPLALIQIDEGKIQSLNFGMELGENESTGDVEVIYEGLKISMLDADSLDENLRTRIGSFFANTFAVKSDNSENDPRKGEVSFERNREKAVFNYWWKSLQSGLESGVGM